MICVGLSGYAQVGKDTFGQFLVEEYGFTRVSFADTIRRFLLALDPVVDRGWYRVSNAVEEYGWEAAKLRYHEVRLLLQRLGTDAGRGILGDDVWIRATLRGLDHNGRYVFTDVRFENEAQAIDIETAAWRACSPDPDDHWTKIVRITRLRHGPHNSHESETAMDDWPFDYIVDNEGDLVKLRQGALTLMADLGVAPCTSSASTPPQSTASSRQRDQAQKLVS